jgi:TorA maturation chaperone TorD
MNTMKIRNWLIEYGLPIMLAACVGILGTLFVQSKDAATKAAVKVTQLEKDLRTATGKLYDLQERNDDAQSAEMAAAYVKLYEAEKALEACQKGKP